jgi:hypothetical protein
MPAICRKCNIFTAESAGNMLSIHRNTPVIPNDWELMDAGGKDIKHLDKMLLVKT